jgi:hypothetical protein
VIRTIYFDDFLGGIKAEVVFGDKTEYISGPDELTILKELCKRLEVNNEEV